MMTQNNLSVNHRFMSYRYGISAQNKGLKKVAFISIMASNLTKPATKWYHLSPYKIRIIGRKS